jgi:uncharacterized protein
MTHRRRRPFRLFLDANVLVSAAWKPDSKVAQIWAIPNVELITSNYVVEECRRNLPSEEQRTRLREFLAAVRIHEFASNPVLANAPPLPAKDQPVLAAAVLTRSDFLVTGDMKHFGACYGSTLEGVRIERPARFPSVLAE